MDELHTVQHIHFKIHYLNTFRLLLQLYIENHFNDTIPKHLQLTYNELLYYDPITEEEMNELLENYADLNDLIEPITITGEVEQQYELFRLLPILDRFTIIRDRYIREGSDYSSCIIDLHEPKQYPCSFGEHFKTLMTTINTNYPEFHDLPQEEQDCFVMKHFRFKGQNNPPESYANQAADEGAFFYRRLLRGKEQINE